MTFFDNAFIKTKFWCLSSNLSYPEDLKKQWLHRRVGFRNSNKGGSLRPPFFQIVFLYRSLSQSSLSSLSSFPLASLPSLLAFWSIVCLKIKTSCFIQLVYSRGCCALPSVLLHLKFDRNRTLYMLLLHGYNHILKSCMGFYLSKCI